MLKLFVCSLIAVISASVFSISEQTIYLVRHAEKLADKDDPGLTKQGISRAQRLAQLLRDKNISVIYSTQYRRTLATAQPLADRLEMTISIYDPYQLTALASKVKASGQNTLIVGHSNTTPPMAAALGANPGEAIKETEYDRLYIIKINGDQVTSRISRYPSE